MTLMKLINADKPQAPKSTRKLFYCYAHYELQADTPNGDSVVIG